MATAWEVTKLIMLSVGWWMIPLIFLFIYKKKLSKYPVDVVIFEKRGENIVYSKDVAGRFEKPVTCYKMKNTKDTIPIPNYDWILQNMSKPTSLPEKIVSLLSGKIGAIVLFKYGSKQYKPIDVALDGGKHKTMLKEVKNSRGEPVVITVYEPINPKQSMSKLDFDVIDWDDINHMNQELRAIAVRRSPVKTFLEKYGGHIALAIGFLSLVIAGFFYKEILLDAASRYQSIISGAPAPTPEPASGGGPLSGFLPGG